MLKEENRRVVLVSRVLSENAGEGAMKTRVTIAKREHELKLSIYNKKC